MIVIIVIVIVIRNTRKTVKDDLVLTIHPGKRFKMKIKCSYNDATWSHEVHNVEVALITHYMTTDECLCV